LLKGSDPFKQSVHSEAITVFRQNTLLAQPTANPETTRMGLLRLILLAILAVLIYRLLRNWQTRRAADSMAKPADQGKMLACDHCGLYLPEQDAVRDGVQVFCSEAHRLAHRQDQA